MKAIKKILTATVLQQVEPLLKMATKMVKLKAKSAPTANASCIH
jgi:hypothetical protein